MDLRTDFPYSLMRSGIIHSYPSLNKDLKTDVAVIGAGITGAVVAYYLSREGFKVTVIDKRHVGMGSTAASTGLLQYEIDTPLVKLRKMVGEKNAILCYLKCRQAILDLKIICDSLNMDTDFRLRPSFQYASVNSHYKLHRQEYLFRKKIGFDVSWLEETDIVKKFGFKKAGGILSEDAGEVDAYALTHALLGNSDLQVFDHTEVTRIDHKKDSVGLVTAGGHKIKARYIIIACGYESQTYLPFKVENLHNTYSIVSEENPQITPWYRCCLIWETGTPYLYLRFSTDKRFFIGGKDDKGQGAKKRDMYLNRKSKLLEQEFMKLFPDKPFKTDFKWGGIFADTKDGLPYVGKISRWPRCFFSLGYGGNGITFSILAAGIITDQLTGKKNPLAGVFSFER